MSTLRRGEGDTRHSVPCRFCVVRFSAIPGTHLSPTAPRPGGFSGAVGNFFLRVSYRDAKGERGYETNTLMDRPERVRNSRYSRGRSGRRRLRGYYEMTVLMKTKTRNRKKRHLFDDERMEKKPPKIIIRLLVFTTCKHVRSINDK